MTWFGVLQCLHTVRSLYFLERESPRACLGFGALRDKVILFMLVRERDHMLSHIFTEIHSSTHCVYGTHLFLDNHQRIRHSTHSQNNLNLEVSLIQCLGF